jgi:hypothetical protein
MSDKETVSEDVSTARKSFPQEESWKLHMDMTQARKKCAVSKYSIISILLKPHVEVLPNVSVHRGQRGELSLLIPEQCNTE